MLAKLLASYSLTPNDLKHCCGYTKDGTLPIVKTCTLYKHDDEIKVNSMQYSRYCASGSFRQFE